MPIEHIVLRGGPRDGEQFKDVGAEGLPAAISVPTVTGVMCRYRKTGEYSQLRGADIAEPYARTWLYDWMPDGNF